MKRRLYFLTILILLFSARIPAENRVDVGPVYMNWQRCDYYLEVMIENDETIQDFTIGLSFTPEYASYLDIDLDDIMVVHGSRADGALQWNFEVRNYEEIDTAIIIGHSSLPDMQGIAPGPLETMFYIRLNPLMEGSGYLAVDSCTEIPPYGSWAWGDIQPDIDDINWIECAVLPCGWMEFDSIPENDIITADHCDGASFHFYAHNEVNDSNAVGFGICHFDLIPQITDAGVFAYPPADPGTYPVTVEAWDPCPVYGNYTFDVVLTNSPMSFTNCPQEELSCSVGWAMQQDLGLEGLDCDPVTENIEVIWYPGNYMPHPPTCNNGIFEWRPTWEALGVTTFEITASDPFGAMAVCTLLVEVRDIPGLFCGDANRDQEVNVSDAVYIINYIFVGGPPPDPMDNANVNCDFTVNVSDAVWIINFVFVGGPPPCYCE